MLPDDRTSRDEPSWAGIGRPARGASSGEGLTLEDFSIAMIPSAVVVGLGVLGCVAPRRVEQIVGIRAVGTTGIAEIRATYGGLFLALGIGLFYFNDPKVYMLGALTGFGAAILRTVSVVIDKSRDKENLASIAFEVTLGVLFLFH